MIWIQVWLPLKPVLSTYILFRRNHKFLKKNLLKTVEKGMHKHTQRPPRVLHVDQKYWKGDSQGSPHLPVALLVPGGSHIHPFLEGKRLFKQSSKGPLEKSSNRHQSPHWGPSSCTVWALPKSIQFPTKWLFLTKYIQKFFKKKKDVPHCLKAYYFQVLFVPASCEMIYSYPNSWPEKAQIKFSFLRVLGTIMTIHLTCQLVSEKVSLFQKSI